MEQNGAEMILTALAEHGVDTIFGYPGGAVLPLYDAIFQQDKIKHILVRHEQAAVHGADLVWCWSPVALGQQTPSRD
jgi:acetolactate synthase I/II/III large subunit